MDKLLIQLYRFFKRKRGVFAALLTIVLAALTYGVMQLRVQEDFMQLLPKDKAATELTAFLENSKLSDKVMICLSMKDSSEGGLDSLVVYSDELADTLQTYYQQEIADLEYTADATNVSSLLEVLNNNIPVFLEENDYRTIDSLLTDSGMQKKLDYNYRTLISPTGIALKQFIIKDPLGFNFIAYKKLNGLLGNQEVELYDQHFVTRDQQHLLLFLSPKHPSKATAENKLFFSRLDESLKHISAGRYQAVYFGAPAVAAANAAQIQRDTSLTIFVSVLALLIVIVLFFRKWISSLLLMVPVLFGALFALACIALFKGEISVIAIASGSLILGIAINYSLHFLTHLKYHPNTEQAIKDLTAPLTIGSATTIAGFMSLQLVKAPILQDLGLFAALSLIGAALATLIILPQLLPAQQGQEEVDREDKWYDRALQRLRASKVLLVAFIVLTPFFLYFAPKVEFESDMYRLSYLSDELREAEQTVNSISSVYQKSVFVVTNDQSLEASLAKQEQLLPAIHQLKKEGLVLSHSGIAALYPSAKEQEQRIARWNAYWTAERRQQVATLIQRYGADYHFKASAFEPLSKQLEQQYHPLEAADRELLKQSVLRNFVEERDGQVSVISILKVAPGQSQVVHNRLQAAEAQVFDREYITKSLVKVVADDFSFITWCSFLIVLVALFIAYGRIELVAITLLPMVVSWIWILGIMALLHIPFNIFNIILSTLVFALGDDYSIFTTDSLQQQYSKGAKSIPSVRVSIFLSAITTVIGLGMLILAKHPALNSIALVSIIGISCVWLISQTLQPALFDWLITRRAAKGLAPITAWRLSKTLFAFSYFAFGAILLTLIGFLFIACIPGKNKRIKYAYHWLMANFCRSMVYIMANVKKTIINTAGEDFKQPAIIVANHQSFLDILLTVMLTPRVVLMTNRWVWRSPFFGWVVQYADYILAEETEQDLDRIQAKVADGYSIVIFPEGTRSLDGKIARFHKGAFYLAETLQLPILPIVIHGPKDCMPKNDFMLDDGHLSVKILPRIAPGDTRFGSSYQEQAKAVGRYMREEYEVLRAQQETVEYYREQLLLNYVLKGPIMEWYMRIKTQLEQNYRPFDEVLPRSGKIIDIGCGYGFLPYMLSYTSTDREVIGIDYDEEKITVAAHGYSRTEKLQFAHANAVTYPYERYQGMILSDVLHYLLPEQQQFLLQRCAESLDSGGTLIIRDGISELETKHKGTKLSEFFSTRLLGFNKTADTGLHFISERLIIDLAKEQGMNIRQVDQTRFTSNIIYILTKN